MLLSTSRIVRGGPYAPLKKTHKDLCDWCNNHRVLEVVDSSTKKQFQVNWSILKKLDHFEFCVNHISVPLPTKIIKLESNKYIKFFIQKLLVPIFFA